VGYTLRGKGRLSPGQGTVPLAKHLPLPRFTHLLPTLGSPQQVSPLPSPPPRSPEPPLRRGPPSRTQPRRGGEGSSEPSLRDYPTWKLPKFVVLGAFVTHTRVLHHGDSGSGVTACARGPSRRAPGLLLGWFCSSDIVIHPPGKKSPGFSPRKPRGDGVLCVPPARQRGRGPCRLRERTGVSRRVPLRWGQPCPRPPCPQLCFRPGSRLVWLPGGHRSQTRGALSSPKAPHQPLSPHPLLAWGPGATPRC